MARQCMRREARLSFLINTNDMPIRAGIGQAFALGKTCRKLGATRMVARPGISS